MSNAIALNDDFQQRIFTRIRDSIGDLMTDEDLRKLLETSIQKAFFEPRRVPRSTYSGTTYETADPVFIEEVRKLLDTQVKSAIRKYMDENTEAIHQGIKQEMAKALPALIVGMVKAMVDNNSMTIVNELRNQGVIR